MTSSMAQLPSASQYSVRHRERDRDTEDEIGTWLPMDFDGQAVPPAPPPVLGGGNCTAELVNHCPHDGSSSAMSVACRLERR